MEINWHNHFSSLLVEAPNIEDKEVEAVLLYTGIDDGPISQEEYHTAE